MSSIHFYIFSNLKNVFPAEKAVSPVVQGLVSVGVTSQPVRSEQHDEVQEKLDEALDRVMQEQVEAEDGLQTELSEPHPGDGMGRVMKSGFMDQRYPDP